MFDYDNDLGLTPIWNDFGIAPIWMEYIMIAKNISVNRPFKLKISIEGTCFLEESEYEIESDSSEDEEEEEPKPIEESFKTDTCIICLDKEPNILFTDCKHICMCLECVKIKSLDNCPYCRNKISKRIKI